MRGGPGSPTPTWLGPEFLWFCPVTADAATAVLTVIPVLAYLVLTESGGHRAT